MNLLVPTIRKDREREREREENTVLANFDDRSVRI